MGKKTQVIFQRPFLDVPSDWRPTPVSQLPSWDGAKRVAVDLETHDPDLGDLGPGVRRGGKVVGVAFAIEGGPAHYLPVAHEAGDNLEPEKVWQYLKDQTKVFRGDIVGANLQYDLDYLLENGVDFGDVWYRDVQVAEPLLDEYRWTYKLDDIAKQWGLPPKDETHLRSAAGAWGLRPKSDLWILPARHVGAYAERDVTLPLEILRLQEAEIERQGIGGAWDLESRVLPVALRMRRRGVRIDEKKLLWLEDWALEHQKRVLKGIKKMTGVDIGTEEVMNAELGYRALEQTGFAHRYTAPTKAFPSGKLSLTKEMLAEIAEKHPLGKMLLWARQTWKIRTTFCVSFRKHMTNGRIHSTFNQCKIQRDDGGIKGAVSRRGSMVSPNMQQLPSPKKAPILGKLFRSICIPEDGMLWGSADFSGQEARIAIHFAVKGQFPDAQKVAEEFRRNPKTDLYLLIGNEIHPDFRNWEPTNPKRKLWRERAKTTFLGLLYAMGGGKLCRSFGLPTEPRSFEKNGQVIHYTGAGPEGQAILDAFDRAAPFAKALSRGVKNRAEQRGFIRLPDGGKRRYGPGKDFPHKAPNGLIQGTAAIQTKTAMVEVDRAGFFLQLQVHDELNSSVKNQGEAREMGRIMEDCFPMEVPSVAGIDVGNSWGDA